MNSTTNSTIPPSVFTHDYTYVQGAWMCIAWMYPIHIGFAYLVALMGIGAFITRVIKPIMFLHVWFGRLFMIFMFCTMASSLVIFNTGLPTAIMVFFVLLTIGQSVGWLAIKIHQMIMEKKALAIVQKKIITMMANGTKITDFEKVATAKLQEVSTEGEYGTEAKERNSISDNNSNDGSSADEEKKDLGEKGENGEKGEIHENVEDKVESIGTNAFNLQKEIGIAKGQIAGSKGFFGRFFSLKSLHALGMFVAWWNIFGRAAVTNPAKWDGCWSYPAYKDTTGNVVYANELKDNGSSFVANVPLFVSVSFVPAFVLFIAFGFCYSLAAGLIALYKQKKAEKK
eukprot:gene8306-130_t